ncbi:hypothetical protein [Peribacillus simplex]|uniref:hypothetical protein n=1 Tax=Peribacillus simplex TaxID=1478 RepID=UPI0024C1C74B|nr:hypothetical protein [Peribacillus simplex]WHY57728.1 hypothetical protein QNH43_05420 [Peribacillus simplex]
MADSRRKGSGFPKSTVTFLKKKTAGKLALYVFLLYETLNGWKKFATLLPNNWLAEAPQTLASRTWQTICGKGADFRNQCNIFKKKTAGKLALYVFLLYETLNGWKKFATLLPNNWLAETPQTLASRRLGRQSAERERISEINCNIFKEKTAGN